MRVRLLSHHEAREDHEGQAGKSIHAFFVIFVPFVVVGVLLGLYAQRIPPEMMYPVQGNNEYQGAKNHATTDD